MIKSLIILRGLAGSGKSTFSRVNFNNFIVCSADHYFELKTGSYVFDPRQISSAHAYCHGKLTGLMEAQYPYCLLDNTNTQLWEYKWAIELAKVHQYEVKVISLFDGGLTDSQLAARNAHGVPIESIAKMRARWQKDPAEVSAEAYLKEA